MSAIFPWISSSDPRSTSEPLDLVQKGTRSETVVCLHGLFGSPEHFSGVVEGLSDRYRIIAPQLPIDQRANRRRDGVRSIADLTDIVERTLDSLGLETYVLCGNSLGGLIAMDLALRAPDRVRGLVLAGSAGLYERSLTSGVKPRPTPEFVRSVVSDIFYDQAMVTDALVKEWLEIIRDRDYARFLLRISRATRDRSVQDELHRLTMPTLIVWGRDDKITPPEVAEEFRGKIPHAELHFIDRCGHSPNLEHPETFASLLEDFLPICFPSATSPSKPR